MATLSPSLLPQEKGAAEKWSSDKEIQGSKPGVQAVDEIPFRGISPGPGLSKALPAGSQTSRDVGAHPTFQGTPGFVHIGSG